MKTPRAKLRAKIEEQKQTIDDLSFRLAQHRDSLAILDAKLTALEQINKDQATILRRLYTKVNSVRRVTQALSEICYTIDCILKA